MAAGFKNVSLGNVISSSYGGTQKNTFVSDQDDLLLKKYKVPSFEIQVMEDLYRVEKIYDCTVYTVYSIPPPTPGATLLYS